MNNGFSSISKPSLNGLVDINADVISSSVIEASTILLNGLDITSQLNQVPINTGNIANLQQITTGMTYNLVSDTSIVDNNVSVNKNILINNSGSISISRFYTTNNVI